MKVSKQTVALRLGVQVSVAGKIHYAIDRAQTLGCNAIQIFARNPRQFRKGFLSKEDIALFRKKRKKAALSPLVIHAPYTLNLASADNFLWRASIREFTADIHEAALLGADYIVIHSGNFKGFPEKGLARLTKALSVILEKTETSNTIVLLENMAGDGGSLGHDFSHYRFVFEKLKNPKRLGICFDTAHAWGAGYQINTAKGLAACLAAVDHACGIEKIKIIHLNDTLDDCASHRDKHYHVGRGKIGLRGIRRIINHPRLRVIPFILETPRANEDDDRGNLAFVRKYYNGVTPGKTKRRKV